jgi:excisionase family DNA binding protein
MTSDTLPEILTADHMAKYLGMSRRVIYDLIKTKPEAGGIPSFNIGYSVRVEKSDFVEWIKAQKAKKARCSRGS